MARVKKSPGQLEDVAAEKTVADTPAADLLNTLIAADKQTAIDNARAMVWDSANRPEERLMDPRMGKLVERAFAPKDWEATLDRFDAWMSLGDKRSEEAFIRRSHEQGPEIVREIYDVYLQVRFARESWELENDTMLGLMREQAMQVLEGEKEKKIRTKAITQEDVAKKAASMFPEDWAAQQKRRLQYELVENRSKHCVELGTLRCRILDSMMARLRT